MECPLLRCNLFGLPETIFPLKTPKSPLTLSWWQHENGSRNPINSWLNPIWKNMLVRFGSFPQFSGYNSPLSKGQAEGSSFKHWFFQGIAAILVSGRLPNIPWKIMKINSYNLYTYTQRIIGLRLALDSPRFLENYPRAKLKPSIKHCFVFFSSKIVHQPEVKAIQAGFVIKLTSCVEVTKIHCFF